MIRFSWALQIWTLLLMIRKIIPALLQIKKYESKLCLQLSHSQQLSCENSKIHSQMLSMNTPSMERTHNIDATQYLLDFHEFKISSLVASCFDNHNFWEPNMRYLRSAPWNQTYSGSHKLSILKREALKITFWNVHRYAFDEEQKEKLLLQKAVLTTINEVHSSELKKTLPALGKWI